MTPDARIAITFLADLADGLSRAPLPVPGSEECYSGIDVPTRVVWAAARALEQEGGDLHERQASHDTPPASRLNVPERAHGEFSEYMAETMPMKESAGESVGGIAVPSVEIAPSLSPVGTAPRLPTDRLVDIIRHQLSGGRKWDVDGHSLVVTRQLLEDVVTALSPSPPAELGLETHEHQRKLWGDAHYDKVAPSDTASMWRRVQMLCRDVGRLSAEVARLTSDVTYWQECFMSGNPAREATARAEERERAAKIIDGFADATGQCQRAAGAIRARTP